MCVRERERARIYAHTPIHTNTRAHIYSGVLYSYFLFSLSLSLSLILRKDTYKLMFTNAYIHFGGGCPRGVMVKAMNCRIVVREFVLQSRYYVHFRANTLGKGMNPLILPPAMGK